MFYFKQIKIFVLFITIKLKLLFIIITIIEMELYHNILYRLLINNESKKKPKMSKILFILWLRII